MTRILVVSDPVISQQDFYKNAVAALEESGLAVAEFDECGIDARCSHIDSQGQRVRGEGVDGVGSIGGGSAMCTGKGVAIVATNDKPMAECTAWPRPRAVAADGRPPRSAACLWCGHLSA